MNSRQAALLVTHFISPEIIALNGDVVVNYSDFKNFTSENITSFLPDGNNYGSRFLNNSRLDLNIDTKHSFYMERGWGDVKANLGYNYGKTKNNDNSREATFSKNVEGLTPSAIDDLYSDPDMDPAAIINRRVDSEFTENFMSHVTASAEVNRNFNSYGSTLTLGASGSFNSLHSDVNQSYLLNFGANSSPVQNIRRDFNNYPNHNYGLSGNGYFSIPLTDWLTFSEEYTYSYKSVTGTSDIYILEETGSANNYMNASMRANMPELDFANSYASRQIDNGHTLKTGLSFLIDRSKNWRISLNVPVNLIHRRLSYQRADVDTVASHTNVLPDVNIWMMYMDWMKNKNFNITYNLSTSAPDMVNFIDIVNSTDPLNIYLGNGKLQNTLRHRFCGNFSGTLGKSDMEHEFELSYEYVHNALARGFFYDRATGVRTFIPMNISGDNTWTAKYELFKQFGPRGRFSVRNNLEFLRRTNHDFVSEDGIEMLRSRVRDLRFKDKVTLAYSFSGSKISLFGAGAFNRYTGSLASFSPFNAWDINYGVSGTFKLPYNFGITTDFTVFMHRGYNDSALNDQNYVWNARLSWSTLKGNLVLMLDGWDILHDIKNISYRVNTQGRTETYTTVLPRYLMFHVQYRFNKQPKKK